MSERYEAVAVRRYKDAQGNEKSSFTNIGIAWPMKERDGYTLRLHAMPAPVEGEYVVLLMPPKPKDEQQRGGGGQRSSYQEPSRGGSRDIDDDIPF